MILIHIDATVWMWIVFIATVPLRIIIDITAKKLIKAINEDEQNASAAIICGER